MTSFPFWDRVLRSHRWKAKRPEQLDDVTQVAGSQGLERADWEGDYLDIYSSGLFDHEWYARRYPEVARTNLRPLEYYVKHGAALGHLPNSSFSSADLDNECRSGNPLAAYVRAHRTSKATQTTGERIRVSVICITFNHAEYIGSALESILSQEVDFEFEILVGDDHSTDETAKIVTEYAARFPNIVPVLRSRNVGANANFIDLARRARGHYVAICEGDDFWTDCSKLQVQVDYLDSRPTYSICFHKVKTIYEGLPGIEEFHPESCSAEPTLEVLTSDNLIQTNSVMYRWRFHGAAVFDYEPSIAPADWYVHLLHAEVGRVAYIDRVMATYRKHPGSMWANRASELARHKAFGNGEIELFRQLNGHFGGRFDDKFEAARLSLFAILAKAHIEEDAFSVLLALCQHNQDMAVRGLSTLGYSIDPPALNGAVELRQALLAQSKISVIVVSYNHAKYIRRCLESVLAQRGFFQLEVIVGDDCSTDGTSDIIAEIQAQSAGRIRVLKRPGNVGMLSNLRDCIDASTGDFIAVCEGDDYWLSDRKLSRQLEFIRTNRSFDMCFSWVLLQHTDGSLLPHPQQEELQTGPLSFGQLARNPLTANFSCCFFRAAAAKRVPTAYYEAEAAADWLFALYIADRGTVAFQREILSVYTLHPGGQWSGLSDRIKESRILEYRESFADKFQQARQLKKAKYRIRKLGRGIPGTQARTFLDYPTDDAPFVANDDAVTFAGWILAARNAPVSITARTSTTVERFELEVSRPDVYSTVLGIQNVDPNIARCGFKFTLPIEDEFSADLSIDIGGQLYPWLSVQLLTVDPA